MPAIIPYSDEEKAFLAPLLNSGKTLSEIARLCNAALHAGRPIRTAGGIGYFYRELNPESKGKSFRNNGWLKKTCQVCGKEFRHSWPQARYCSKECRAVIDREYANNRYRKNPRAALSATKQKVQERIDRRWERIFQKFGDKCTRCGNTFPRVVYDLHHPDGKKDRSYTPSRIIKGRKEEVFEAMLNEVVLLCANCHRLEHAEADNWGPRQNGSMKKKAK